ncbi:hypothetical protein UFOVP730_16 [uncultured Caudovirales phage]|uniref:C1q domain-containing protein n=1 Tax=uncultured Caudovirales phage TaxID=2100421 RepID=A0A6J5NV17_9CAUD|nr:hypothetical protein UFOVP730_16 [uncultured Caudovirales phage]
MPVRLNSSGGGSVTLDVPSTAGTFTATAPANNGTLVTTGSTAAVSQAMLASGVAGNGPAFLASVSGNASASGSTWTKAPLNAEQFDTNNCFDSTTNFRFTPTVAGYYQISCVNQQLVNGVTYVAIWRNGSLYFQFGATTLGEGGSMLLYLNGSTDYVEMFIYSTNSTGTINCIGNFVSMSGFLARAA